MPTDLEQTADYVTIISFFVSFFGHLLGGQKEKRLTRCSTIAM